MIEKVDIVIIGAGVIGLAVAEKLSAIMSLKGIVVLERHSKFGQEASSRNSEVIHAGIYYPSSSLKAKLCVQGNRELFALCENNNIPYKKIGKLIIANKKEEEQKIHDLLDLGNTNGVANLSLINKSEIKILEPAIRAKMAIFSKETGIVDSHRLMQYLAYKTESAGGIIAYQSEVINLKHKNGYYELTVRSIDNEQIKLHSPLVINCAGLSADKIAQMVGIDIDTNGYRIHPCKGEYFSLIRNYKLKHLVYPAPTDISLGIHTVIDLKGRIRLGPNAFYTQDIDYTIDVNHKNEFYESAREYLPSLSLADIAPDMAGIRAKIQKPHQAFCDFIIKNEKEAGCNGFINLIGIESPGLTSAIAIAQYVSEIIRDI